MQIIKFSWIFLLICSLNVRAESKYVIVMGGGGEALSKKDTIFDDGIVNFSGYTKGFYSRITSTDIAYDGGHADSEAIIKRNFKKSGPDAYFSNQNFNALIDKYKNLILTNKIKSGDKILILINSHGAMNQGATEKTHQVSTTGQANNLQTLAGSSTVSLDRLSELSTLAKTHGLKLGILDMSCFSGNTQKLANENTCVVSATGANHYAWMGGTCFTENFLSEIRAGRNLEEVFLKAREDSIDKGYPMISTPTNEKIVTSVYAAISPYLMYKNMERDGATGLLNEYLFTSHDFNFICKKQQAFTSLLSLVDQVEKANTITEKFLSLEFSFKKFDFTNFKANIFLYKKLQDKMYADYFRNQAQLQEDFEVNYKDDKNHLKSKKYTMQEILQNDYSALLKKEIADPKGSKMMVSLYSSLQDKKLELIAKNPNVKSANEKIKELSFNLIESKNLASKIAEDEKKFYSALYAKFRKEDKKPNPCKDFVL